MAKFTLKNAERLVKILVGVATVAANPEASVNTAKEIIGVLTNWTELDAALRKAGLSDTARLLTEKAEAAAEVWAATPDYRRADIHDILAHFDQAIDHCVPSRTEIVAQGLNSERLHDLMLGKVRGVAHLAPYFADDMPATRLFQGVVTEVLTGLVGDTDTIAKLTPDLWRALFEWREEDRQGHATTHAKQDDQTAMLRELLARTAPGLPLATAQEILRSFGEMVENPDPARVETLLKAKAEEYATLRARLGELDNSGDLVVRDLLRAARDLIDRAEFDAADAKMVEAEHHADLTRARVRASRADLALLRLNHRDAAAHFAAAAAIVPATDAATRWSYEERRCDALTTLGRDFGDNAALREAIHLYHDTVLPLAPRDTAPETWAGTQNNLGNALSTLGEREAGTARLDEAVAAYRAALEVWTRETAPLEWATTQNNLGIALRTLGAREEGTARLEEAVEAYRAALEVRTRETVPLNWATTQNNLGTALQTLGAREAGTARQEEAVKAYRAALEVWTRETVPLDWATTQNNLGIALRTLGEREAGTARLEEAVAAYRAALEVWTRETVPLDWATTQNNLGTALSTLGAREAGTARLDEAVKAYRAALEVLTRETVPLNWATTQNNLGVALQTLGAREAGTARLEEAVKAYRAALEVWTRETVPLDWATTQNNLGIALRTLGEREAGTARLEEAVAAYRAALEVRTRETVPLDWASTQNNLGNALSTLGEREEGTVRLEAAVKAYRAALEVRTRETVPLDWAGSTGNQGGAMVTLGERTRDAGMIRAAIGLIRTAAEVMREGGHVPHARIFENQLPGAEAALARLTGR